MEWIAFAEQAAIAAGFATVTNFGTWVAEVAVQEFAEEAAVAVAVALAAAVGAFVAVAAAVVAVAAEAAWIGDLGDRRGRDDDQGAAGAVDGICDPGGFGVPGEQGAGAGVVGGHHGGVAAGESDGFDVLGGLGATDVVAAVAVVVAVAGADAAAGSAAARVSGRAGQTGSWTEGT